MSLDEHTLEVMRRWARCYISQFRRELEQMEDSPLSWDVAVMQKIVYDTIWQHQVLQAKRREAK